MSSIYTWSTDPGSNATADEDINWAEGMPPSAVNNSARAMMGRVAEYVKDTGGALTAGGTGNALTLTANSAITAYANGQRFVFRATAANTGATTVNINSAGSKAIRKLVGDEDVALEGGEIVNGGVYEIVYSSALNSGAGAWQLMNLPVPAPRTDYVPTGTVLPFAGSTAPTDFLLCYGQAVSRTTYAALFAAIGTTYGSGNGSTTFNVPDLRGRVVAGQDDMGGTSADRLTGATSGGINGDNLGSSGGEEAVTLATAHLPSHSHGAGSLSATSSGSHRHAMYGGTGVNTTARGIGHGGAVGVAAMDDGTNNTYRFSFGGNGVQILQNDGAHTHTISGSTDTTGSGSQHNNVQPTLVLNYIIRT